MPANSWVQRPFGRGRNEAAEVIAHRAQRRLATEDAIGSVAAVVTAYDFARQRVSVRLKNRPEVLPLGGVPIAQTGGCLRIIRRVAVGEVGQLQFLQDRDGTFNDALFKGIQRHRSNRRGLIFVPGPSLLSDDLHDLMLDGATATDADHAGPEDCALLHESGSGLIFKGNGDVVVKAAGDIYWLADNAPASSSNLVARQNDAVSDTEITGGSSNVRSS